MTNLTELLGKSPTEAWENTSGGLEGVKISTELSTDRHTVYSFPGMLVESDNDKQRISQVWIYFDSSLEYGQFAGNCPFELGAKDTRASVRSKIGVEPIGSGFWKKPAPCPSADASEEDWDDYMKHEEEDAATRTFDRYSTDSYKLDAYFVADELETLSFLLIAKR